MIIDASKDCCQHQMKSFHGFALPERCSGQSRECLWTRQRQRRWGNGQGFEAANFLPLITSFSIILRRETAAALERAATSDPT
jgi:hypothetical protein